MEYIFDIDNTICHPDGPFDITNFDNMQPDEEMIAIINELHDSGHTIVMRTGRGGHTGIDFKEKTQNQLNRWGVKYHRLEFVKKPLSYMYIDDRACSPQEFKRRYKDGML